METFTRYYNRVKTRSSAINRYLIAKGKKEEHEGSYVLEKAHSVALFAHWDPHGVIDDYVINYLKILCDNDIATILVSTAPRLEHDSLKQALKYTYRIFLRENIGLDFASWKLAILEVPEINTFEHLLFLNDSVYGPFHDISPTIQKLRSKENGLWGMNDSLEKNCHHIQSFFLSLTPEVIHHPYFKKFLNRVGIITDKEEVIMRYEVGLGARTTGSKVELKPLFPFKKIANYCLSLGEGFQYADWAQRGPFNTTIFAWDILLEKFHYPLLKTEVLKLDRFHSRSIPYWRDFIPQEGKYMIPKIEKHLSRIAPNSKGL